MVPGVTATQNFKRNLFLYLYREGEINITLVCFLLPLKREIKMYDTCSLFPPFGHPWPSCLLPSQYDLNQIPYGYTVEVTNRFKRLDLIDRVPEELWMEVHDSLQEVVIKNIPKKKKCKKGKMVI